ncbi:NADH-quinone oxidoreductase [Cristinia sonorae]|uniref:NADH-quinone oxidoreductase n=1 Tax=Cristinia sonorae TaxID=1940300 RepID=A0A8K0XUI9_9AGAR|nr:NADH-quinone oxidoreductase [Cristinia sonorae]
MCFPGKRQKALLSDEPAPVKKTPASVEETTPVPESTTTESSEVTKMSAPRVAIIIYTMYGHVTKVAESILAGIKEAGGDAKILQIAETLPKELLTQLHAPPKPDYPIITPEELVNYDAYLLGIPTRYGNFPVQWKAFWDATGGLWAKGALAGKYAGLFISTGTMGGGQESTAIAAMSTLSHHGIVYVPFGYSSAFDLMSNISEVHGGSPWGSGTFAAADGSRQPSELELKIASAHGKQFWKSVARVNFN